MRMSKLIGRTLRKSPADADTVARQLLLRAGMVCRLDDGRYACLPMGRRVLLKIAAVIRLEMMGAGGQEVLLPLPQPSAGDGPEITAYDETAIALLRREIESYRQLPLFFYHIGPEVGNGSARAWEFLRQCSYSAHADAAALDAFYNSLLDAYRRAFARCGLAPLTVEAAADTGHVAWEFVVPRERGAATVLLCDSCGYAANAECATFDKHVPPPAAKPATTEMPVEIATPNCKTIAQVAAFVGVPTWQTMKAVFFTTVESPRLVFVVIRGDLEVNEAKLRRALGGVELRPAEENEIRAVGAVPGYASPIGTHGALVVADDSLLTGSYVAGANRVGYHLRGVRYGRDFEGDLVADIALAGSGDRCARCGGRLRAERATVLGRCRKLGTRYTEPPGVTYLDATGQARPIAIGSCDVGLGRLMEAIVEEHHDEYGICWPAAVAPYQVHLVSLVRGEMAAKADSLYEMLRRAGIDVLYDDRAGLSAGVRFNDADLIGCPLRLTISKRSLERGGVEAKVRTSTERVIVPPAKVVEFVRATGEAKTIGMPPSSQEEKGTT